MGAALLFASPPGLTSASPQGQAQRRRSETWAERHARSCQRRVPGPSAPTQPLSADRATRSCASGRERLRGPPGPCVKAPRCEEARTPGGFTARPGEQGDGVQARAGGLPLARRAEPAYQLGGRGVTPGLGRSSMPGTTKLVGPNHQVRAPELEPEPPGLSSRAGTTGSEPYSQNRNHWA